MKVELTFDLPIVGCKRCRAFETYGSEEAWNKGMTQTCKHAELCKNAINLFKEDSEKMKELELLRNEQ